MSKTCSKCGVEKPLSSYTKDSRKKDGLCHACKPCRKAVRDAWVAENTIRHRANIRHWRHLNPEAARVNHKRAECKKKGLEFDLDAEYLKSIWTGVCPIFNVPIDLEPTLRHDSSAEIDRLNPKFGYVRGNVWWISSRANRIKSDASVQELRQIANALEQQLEGANQ